MSITAQKTWDRYVENNKDPYGESCIIVAKRVMEILDTEPGEIDAHKLINRADDDETDAGGITGFMASAVAAMVSSVHSRGKEFKKSWNKFYGIANAKGVANPAILTIKD